MNTSSKDDALCWVEFFIAGPCSTVGEIVSKTPRRMPFCAGYSSLSGPCSVMDGFVPETPLRMFVLCWILFYGGALLYRRQLCYKNSS